MSFEWSQTFEIQPQIHKLSKKHLLQHSGDQVHTGTATYFQLVSQNCMVMHVLGFHRLESQNHPVLHNK